METKDTHPPAPILYDRPDKTGTNQTGVLFLTTPCRDSYKKAVPFPQDRLATILARNFERIETLGGFQPRPLPRIHSNGPRVWAYSVCFRSDIWEAASKKAAQWMPDPQTPDTRGAFFFDRHGAIVAVAMPYCAKDENPAIVPLSEYEAAGLDTSPQHAADSFAHPWSRFTPHDLYRHGETGRSILVPIDSTLAETMAKTPEYKTWSVEGWEKVTPVEHKLPERRLSA